MRQRLEQEKIQAAADHSWQRADFEQRLADMKKELDQMSVEVDKDRKIPFGLNTSTLRREDELKKTLQIQRKEMQDQLRVLQDQL